MSEHAPPDIFPNANPSPQEGTTTSPPVQKVTAVPNNTEPPSHHGNLVANNFPSPNKTDRLFEFHQPPLEMDLVTKIKGMYRILDLISEQGSGGLVDKVIIDQQYFGRFANALYPGAYTSLTKVDFKALDTVVVKPVGVYGERTEIISLLLSMGIVDNSTAEALHASKDDYSGPRLRSGLYLARKMKADAPGEHILVIYWPEDTTWHDDAVTSVRRNRVTFMRYLTKLTDQIFCLLSPDQGRSIIWRDELEDSTTAESDEDQPDRLFTFEVAKTNEQEESVTVRPGFSVFSPEISLDFPRSSQSIALPVPSQPRLLAGETSQAFLKTAFIPSSSQTKEIDGTFNQLTLRELLTSGSIELVPDIKDEVISLLILHGLRARYPKSCEAWKRREIEIIRECKQMDQREMEETKAELKKSESAVRSSILRALIDRALEYYPQFERTSVTPENETEDVSSEASISDLFEVYPDLEQEVSRIMNGDNWKIIPVKKFQDMKKRLIAAELFLDEREGLGENKREEWVRKVLDKAYTPPKASKTIVDTVLGIVGVALSRDVEQVIWIQAEETYGVTSDGDFLSHLRAERCHHPLLAAEMLGIQEVAHKYFQEQIRKHLKYLSEKARHLQESFCRNHIDRVGASRRAERQGISRDILAREMRDEASPDHESRTVKVNNIEVKSTYGRLQVHIKGQTTSQTEPALEYRIHALGLSTEHRHNLQLDSSFIPLPNVQKLSCSFRLPVEHQLLHVQLLESKILVIVDDRREGFSIFLESLETIGGAISRGHPRRRLRHDKIGRDILVSFDETKRMLSLCALSKFQLYVFVFDEKYTSLQAWGNALNLAPWYNTDISICRSCFVSGTEELLLIDTSGQARIFSLITQQFRPASLSLPHIPTAALASPDGACLLLLFPTETPTLRAYHWATFGSTQGIVLDISPLSGQDMVLTSTANRHSIHLLELDLKSHRCHSVALDITTKATEFMFKEKSSRFQHPSRTTGSVCNSLIDSHAEVWTRFPVVPAVQRQTITSAGRCQKTLLFITEISRDRYCPYFADLIRSFEQRSRKPTGDVLKNIVVDAIPFRDLLQALSDKNWNLSQFGAGEWLVDLLCLIPLHIAITRDNRFSPLKDGVTSAELERTLLGAEVGRIVDSLSVGWYESIFKSYMTDKPVKVVSSMGEQSVGKSFSLNHLVDTSFAGSAMRTTEGVWMSVTPTSDTLVVALDFEGVHSIERSAQEDTLLVLFNTAISNLVLFRNNFALSRDITGLFQSFQSSSTVLDPAANPSLFRSTLAIIIKDVVDSDKSEIVREFSLKFQKIVQEEQDANFISRLHAGRLNIIPWPVIESRQFYTLFPALKRQLDRQEVTHHTAGEFLHTLKTLMAKLKANDWGALSQTLAAHRAHRLLTMLPNALIFGYAEVDPDYEPLKNMDTDAAIEKDDTCSRFIYSGTTDQRESALAQLCTSWEKYGARSRTVEVQWIAELSSHLSRLVDLRIDRVQEWISSNLSRFKTGNAGVDELQRMLDTAIVDMRANVELCKAKCSSCHLSCLLSRRHDSVLPHDCQTSHRCRHECDFENEHSAEEAQLCGYSAGHPGQHICVVDAHLCGEPCMFNDKQGCLGECTEVAGHPGEVHVCAAPVHACGEPCALDLRPFGKAFFCPSTCGRPSDQPHEKHACDNRMCPLECQLCKRLCSNEDHLHGLEPDAVHLCGQSHSCSALCQAEGICEIETAPQSIEATFTGRHETFQYTKYSQVAKRLRCVVPIPGGLQNHPGKHVHSTEASPFHFCETRCESCGYFCTLPRGHSQQDHETSHGSMSKTRWAVDGPDGTILELNGRKFSSNDDGAPMMCNLVCHDLGRHAHLAFCRTDSNDNCGGQELQHIPSRVMPDPDRAKDWITHSLHWKRSGFKDPYSRDDQTSFGRCDAMCGGPEHAGTATNPAQPSYCTLPMFHPPHASTGAIGLGYVSNDGHLFPCKNPAVMQQAFHVIFVIDRSGSMGGSDRRPLPGTPATAWISRTSNNRLGAVYSSLYAFWLSRQAALDGAHSNSTGAVARRDAYSVILFDHYIVRCIENDFTSSPDQLLAALLPHQARGGTDYTAALKEAEQVIRRNWSTERAPVVIFLSDGECSVSDGTVRTTCRSAIALGKSLSLHSVAFGPGTMTLRRMAQIALEVQNSAPRDPSLLATAMIDSSFTEALDTVRLAETFLGIAESLRKPRGSLMH